MATRIANSLAGALLGVTLGFATLFAMRVLGPRWENDPSLGPLAGAAATIVGYWFGVAVLRRYTGLLDGATRYVMLGAVCLTWLLIYGAVKGQDDPPVFAFLGPLLWLPAVAVLPLAAKLGRGSGCGG